MKISKAKPVVEYPVSDSIQLTVQLKSAPLEQHPLGMAISGDGVTDVSTMPEPSVVLVEAGQLPVMETTETTCPSGKEATCPPWRVFTSTFFTIFLAELGDKTQISTLLMSAEFHKPWIVFAGAGTALVATTLLGVLVGQWLSNRLSPRTLDISAGIMLALISLWLIWDVIYL